MNNIFDIIKIMYPTLKRILLTYINTINVGTNKQGSKEWHNNRKKTIGSSEIHNATGTQKQVEGVINKKLGRSRDIYGCAPIVWGNLMESSSKIVTSVIMGCDIHNVNGSILNTKLVDDQGNPINSDSPDGMGVIILPANLYQSCIRPIHVQDTELYGKLRFSSTKSADRKQFITSIIYGGGSGKKETNEYQVPQDVQGEMCLIAHFEFKSPCTREIIPEYISNEYLYQKLSGLDVFDIAQVGVFSEVKFSTRNKFVFEPIRLTDLCRSNSTHPCYFAMTKYVVMNDEKSIEVIPYCAGYLSDKKITQDYEVVDGPFMYYLGGTFVFQDVDNFLVKLGIKYDTPTTVEEFNYLCEKILYKLQGTNTKYYIYHQVEEFSIKLIRKMPGFLENFKESCISVIQRVNCQ